MIKDNGVYNCKHFKDEKQFTGWFGGEVKNIGGFWHKISDMDSRMKPCDAIMVLDGETYLIEIKVGDEKKKADVYNKLRPNQKAGLRNIALAGGLPIVIYYNKLYNRYYVSRFYPHTEQIQIDLSKEIII